MKSVIKKYYYNTLGLLRRGGCICARCFYAFIHLGVDYKKIPIIINNYNRLEYLPRLIKSLKNKGYHNIYVLDNASTYPPLLNYYKQQTDFQLIKLNDNFGHRALYLSGVIKQFCHSYFVYTDPDLELIKECPDDFLLIMLKQLRKHPTIDKIALSLKIDDLPDCYAQKNKVIEWESRFWTEMRYGMYRADVDTTFALHQPNANIGFDDDDIAYRMPYPYVVRHLPWYEDSSIVSEEDKYYLAHKRTDVSWWFQTK